jgi:DNA-binding transcriptional MerR regulator
MVGPGASWMPIRELSRRVGVSPDVLRKWERRYGVLKPGRTLGNQRLYSRVDEVRMRLMVDHVRSGMAPAQAAEMAVSARFKINTARVPATTPVGLTGAAKEMLSALERYDETTADQVLEKLLETHSATTIIRDIFLPMLREVGDRWAHSEIRVVQEHFASGFVHGRLLGLARGWDRGLGSRALLACPEGEQHTLGLLAFGIALHQVGWRITYLGADTPVEMLGETAADIGPSLIVIAAAVEGRLEPRRAAIRRLSARWPVALAGAASSARLADGCNARHVADDPVTAAHAIFA